MNITAFLERIAYQNEIEPTLDVLTQLQHHFLLAVPFENLYIQRKIPLDYSPDGAFNKIVINGRGGVCYEANGLFHDALTALGYKVNFIGAEMNSGNPFTGEFNHMALVVELDEEKYLVDVGNGKAFGAPKPINSAEASPGEDTLYKVADYDDIKALYSLNEEQEWVPRYIFEPKARERYDFDSSCHYVQTSPESHFTQKLIASLLKSDGRLTLTDSTLIRTVGDYREEREIETKGEVNHILISEFGLVQATTY